jgi:hypothetical protein
MKRGLITFTFVMFLATLVVFGQTSFSQRVADMWYAGKKQEVLDIANQRLRQDTDDIAGLILKMEYHITFTEIDQATNTMARILRVGSKITAKNFAAIFPQLQGDIEHLKANIPSYSSPQELAADRAKGNIPHKPFPRADVLQALEKDGYFR